MKKLIILVAIIGMVMVAQAQQDIRFGIKGGLNFATISGEDLDDSEARKAFHIGIFSEVPLSGKFSLQPELLLSSQGIKENDDWPEFRLNYLQLPVMAKYDVAESLSIEAGVQIGLLLSANSKVEGEREGDAKGIFKDFDAAINFGLGYQLDNGLNFGARYSLGVSKLFDYFYFGEDVKAYNKVFQISVGYFFN